MASLKTRLVFLFTGRLPQRDAAIDRLKDTISEKQMRLEKERNVCYLMHGSFWHLYETVLSAKDLDSLAESAVEIGDRYEQKTGYMYDRRFVREWKRGIENETNSSEDIIQ